MVRSRRADALAWALPVAATVLFLISPHGGPIGTGLAPGRFPEAMATAFERLGVRGPIYNPVRFGGYLAWRLDEPTFVDGRNEVHAPLIARMAECQQKSSLGCWEGLMQHWNVLKWKFPEVVNFLKRPKVY